MPQPLTVPPGTPIRLSEFSPGDTSHVHDRTTAKKKTRKAVKELGEWGYRLYAENRRAVLVVLQGMDTAGKDGVIRKAMRGFDPQSCQVTPFKTPSQEELDHDFLWRIQRAVPRRGNIGIFNRSHYEDVVIVRVHDLVPEAEWRTRYDRINAFENLLIAGGTTIVKIFLHISRDEQKRRLQSRLEHPHKRWKFSLQDLAERKRWDAYQEAYGEALTRCNTEAAPWHIIPADHKWYRNYLVSRLLRETLKTMDPKYPASDAALAGIVVE